MTLLKAAREWGSTVAVFGVTIALCVFFYSARPRQVGSEESAPPEATSPPCIHQDCRERPAYLIGEDCGAGLCSRFRIRYEHHCVCDRWGSALPERDGGPP